MTDVLARRMERARDQIDVAWSPERAAHNQRAVLRKHRRRVATRAAMVVLLLIGAGLATVQSWRPAAAPARPPQIEKTGVVAAPLVLPLPAAPVEPTLPLWTRSGAEVRFRDGSCATVLGPDTRLATTRDAPGRTVVRLESGGARFDVVHNPARVFRVDAHDAAVEVLGTRFSIERTPAGVHVAVEHGRVRVLFPGGAAELRDGQDGVFPGAPERLRPPPPRRRHDAPPPLPVAPAAPDWRALAAEGHFERAYHTLETGRGDGALSEVSDEPGDLLILADVARLSRHPAQAVAALRKVVDAYPGDPRAPLAAFTLGRVLLDDLGRPQQAAAAFAQAQGLDPLGPMVEDALAREVEAWSRAGDVTQARARAEQYRTRYPQGRRLRSVRRYGGLE